MTPTPPPRTRSVRRRTGVAGRAPLAGLLFAGLLFAGLLLAGLSLGGCGGQRRAEAPGPPAEPTAATPATTKAAPTARAATVTKAATAEDTTGPKDATGPKDDGVAGLLDEVDRQLDADGRPTADQD